MKFGAEWKARMARVRPALPPRLLDACINYRTWKKLCNQKKNGEHDTTALLRVLDFQVSNLDRVYAFEIRHMLSHKFWSTTDKIWQLLSKATATCYRPSSSCSKEKEPISDDKKFDIYDWSSLHEYTAINRKAVYKITKRMDKMKVRKDGGTVVSAVDWYRRQRAATSPGCYAVLANDHTWKQLQMRSQDCENDTCPICLEEEYDACVILRCGHVICRECVLNMIDARHRRGTLRNLVHAHLRREQQRRNGGSTTSACPMCRHPKAFSTFDEYSATKK